MTVRKKRAAKSVNVNARRKPSSLRRILQRPRMVGGIATGVIASNSREMPSFVPIAGTNTKTIGCTERNSETFAGGGHLIARPGRVRI